jgi:hypothetical protein
MVRKYVAVALMTLLISVIKYKLYKQKLYLDPASDYHVHAGRLAMLVLLPPHECEMDVGCQLRRV